MSILSDNQKGAASRPFLTALVDLVLSTIAIEATNCAIDCTTRGTPDTMPSTNPMAPKLQVNGLATVNENTSPSSSTPTNRSAMKMNMLRKIRPPPFRYAYTIYHEKNIPTNTADVAHEDRLTTMLENIITIKTFWECVNAFPFQNLKMKDSIHFFKRGVRPVWEDPRNVDGGAWVFRVSKSVSADFWVEVLLLAVGEQFSEVLGKGDDLCGVSLSRRFNSDLVTIWNRRANDQASVDGIRDTVLAQLSANLKPKEGSSYYKKHSEHQGFDEIVAAAQKRAEVEKAVVEVAKVEDAEAEKALMKEVEEEGGKDEVEKAE